MKLVLFQHILLLLFSISGVFSKLAAMENCGSSNFFLYLSLMLLLLFLYSIGWQIVLRYLPLMLAYANRAVTMLWGIVWGVLLFGEGLTLGKILGAGITMLGVILYFYADRRMARG